MEVMSREEYEELTDILTAAEEHESVLSPVEVNFVADMQARVDLWDRRVKVSPKQFEWLRRIQRRIG
jgi:hypothetical protein